MRNRPEPVASDPNWLDLRKKISVREAARLNSMCEATFRKYHSNLIKQLSPRRQAVQLGDALAIGEAKTVAE